MRIVGVEEFLELGSPLLFIRCDEFGNVEGELSISHGRVSKGFIDFGDLSLNGFVKRDDGKQGVSGSQDDIIKDAIQNGTSFQWDYEGSGRDGLNDHDQLYMVYEKEDVLELIGVLQELYDERYV